MANIRLVEITGVKAAFASLLMSKWSYTPEKYKEISDLVDIYTNPKNGFMNLDVNRKANTPEKFDQITDWLKKAAKWGLGADDMFDGWLDDGHETLLRFIDFTFFTEGLHRGAQDDLDAHAVRFNSRIVRSSTRLAVKDGVELSDWYKGKILPFDEAFKKIVENVNGISQLNELPLSFVDSDGILWFKKPGGYVVAGYQDNADACRGNYPLGLASNGIWKINFVDLMHVYMRRNKYTHASPELRECIESLADQVEEALPILGKFIRYRWARHPNGNYGLTHVMDVKKVYSNRTGEGYAK